jgi:hypothetical protein
LGHPIGFFLGVMSTPTFLIGVLQPDHTVAVSRSIMGAERYEEFSRVFDELSDGKGSRLEH